MPDERIQWHQGYQGGIEFRLRKYKSVLEFHHEHPLGKKPIVLDTLVIEKKEGVVIREDIAAIFLRHNIVEYKNPTDALSIDEYYSLLAYMCRYKAVAGATDAVKADQVTGTLIKAGKPVKAFREILRLGGAVEERYPGIYAIHGLIHMPTQVIVQSELQPERNAALRVITDRASEADVRRFVQETQGLTDADDRRNADAVYEVSMRANSALYGRLRRDPEMCTAFRELFKDEILEAEQRGVQIGEQRGVQRGIQIGEQRGEQRGIQIGEQRGEQRGIQKGERKGRVSLILKLVRAGKLSREDGAQELDIPLGEFEQLLAQA